MHTNKQQPDDLLILAKQDRTGHAFTIQLVPRKMSAQRLDAGDGKLRLQFVCPVWHNYYYIFRREQKGKVNEIIVLTEKGNESDGPHQFSESAANLRVISRSFVA